MIKSRKISIYSVVRLLEKERVYKHYTIVNGSGAGFLFKMSNVQMSIKNIDAGILTFKTSNCELNCNDIVDNIEVTTNNNGDYDILKVQFNETYLIIYAYY